MVCIRFCILYKTVKKITSIYSINYYYNLNSIKWLKMIKFSICAFLLFVLNLRRNVLDRFCYYLTMGETRGTKTWSKETWKNLKKHQIEKHDNSKFSSQPRVYF